MNDFRAKIVAELDTSQVEQKISELDGKKVKFGVDGGNAQKEVEKVDNSIKSATKSTKTFGDTLKTSAKLGAAYSITSQAFQAIREAASKAKEAVQEFDAAVMDLRMATGGTYTEGSNLVKEYNELGQAIGATTKEISSGADSWLRQGHSIADTNTLIKDSMILSKVAELESAEATQYLTSAMKGYKVEVENVISIVDKLTAVDLVSATEAGGLAEAMSRTAASADIAGVSMDKLLGYLAATGEVTQKSMTSIGESYKTIFTRMGDIKSGKLQFIDEDGTAESLSDVETVLNNLGIKLRDSNNEFRNFGDVLDEVGASWDDYSTVQKAAISKAFAGTRQSENFKVLMENYGKATEYMEVSMNSAGTAEQKFEAYLDSLEAKTKSLQASFESLAINTFSTEMFGGIIDATSSVVTFLDKTNLLKGTLVGLTAAGAIKAFTMLTTGITNASIRLNEFNSALKLVKAGNIGENEVQMLAKMTVNLSQSQLKAVLSSKALSGEQRIAILTAQGLSKSEAEAALSSMGLATAQGTATVATTTFSGALKGLWATIKANPIFLVATAITAVVAISAKLYESFDEACEKAKEAADAISTLSDKLKETQNLVKDSAERFAKLAQGVDLFSGKNVSLTSDEYEEFLDLSNQLAETFPSLTRVYDENGNAIVQLSGDVDGIVASLENLLEVERQIANQKIVEELPSLYTGVKSQSDAYKDEIDDLISKRKEYEKYLNKVQDSTSIENFINSIEGGEISVPSERGNFGEIDTSKEDILKALGVDYHYSGQRSETIWNEELERNVAVVEWVYEIDGLKGLNFEDVKKIISSKANEMASFYSDEISNLNTQIKNAEDENNANWSSTLSSISSWLSTENSYKVMSDSSKALVQNAINNLDFSELNFDNWDDLELYLQNHIISLFKNGSPVAIPIADLFAIKTEFEVGDISVEDYKKAIADFKEKTANSNLSEDSKTALEMIFGFEFDSEGFGDNSEYSTLINNVKGKLSEEADKQLVDGLTLEDLKIASNLEISEKTLLSWDELKSKIQEAKKEANASSEPLSFIDTISKVESLSAGFDQLNKIYSDVKDREDFDYSSLLNNKDFEDAFGDLDSYNDFIETVTNSPDDIKACQEAFNDLAGQYLLSSDTIRNLIGDTENLTEENKNAVVSILEQHGVANAYEIVNRKLAVDQEKLRTETELGTDAKYDEIEALYKEAVAGSVAQQALAQLAIEKWNFNDNKIKTAEDAEKLLELANAARLTGAELVKLEAAKSVLDEVKSASSRGFWLLEHGEYEKALETLNGNFEIKYDPVTYEDIIVNGGTSEGSGNSKTETAADKFNDYVSKFFDWIEIRLDRLQTKSDKYLSKAEKYLEAGKYKSAKTQYGNLLDNTAKQIKANRSGKAEYQNKADKILDKAVSQGLVSQKGANNIKKKVADGTIDISSYSEDIQTVIENYQEWYEKSLTASENIVSLSEAYVEYAEALANIPLDKLKAKLEDIDFENDVLDAKYEVVTGGDGKKSIAFQKNSILRDKDDNALETYNAKMTAVEDTTADVNSTWKDKSLKDVKSNKYNKGKKKGEELSTQGLKEGSKAYKAVIAYNAALKAQKEALKEAETAEYKYTATLQENAKERFENAKNQYEGDKAINDAEKARAEAVIESLNTNGKSLYGTDAKTAYESAIKENQDAIGIAENELLKMRNQYAKEANTLSDEDRKQAEADIINKESEILNLKTGTKELQDELNSLPLKQLQTEFSDLQTNANELQNALSLKEAKGIRILKSDYEGLIENSQQQIYNLQWQNDELRNQQKGLEKGSQRYEELQDQIDANNESIRNAEQNQVEFNNAIAQLPFDEYEKALELLDAIGNNLKSQADLKESQGVDLSESDYLEQIANETAAIEELQGKKSEAYKNYFKALASVDGAYGGKSSDEWLKEYHGYDTEINNTKASIEELKDAMRDDVFWRTFERAHKDAERLLDTLDSISSLISDEMTFDADGKLTDYGVSKIALLVKQYETARDEVRNYSKDIDNLNRLYAQDEYTPEEYKEELAELQKGLLDAASSMQSFSDSIVDMYENVARSELDSLLELIDARNEALAAKKAYYDYDKTIRDKTKDIQAIEAQLAALQGIDTLEAKSKRVTLEAELAEAQEELDDTVNEHLIEISQDSLSKLSETLEKSFDENWQNIHSSLEETSQIIKDASELTTGSINDINENVKKLLSYYGITTSDVSEESDFTNNTPTEEVITNSPQSKAIDMMQDISDKATSIIGKTFGSLGIKSYAKGTKGVSKAQLAWTQENNKPEIIVRKRDGAILTPLEPGDSVIPNNLSERLFALAKENAPQHVAYKMPEINYSEFGGSNVNFAPAITQKFDNMINIQGSADAATVEDLKKFSKDILEESYKYTSSKIFEGQKRAGGKRRI